MDIDFSDFEELQKYLNKEMNPQEQKIFLSKIKANPDLAEFMTFEKDLKEYLFLKEADNNFQRFGLTKADFNIVPKSEDEKLRKKFIKNRTSKRVAFFSVNHRTFYLVAASLVMLIGSGFIFYFFRFQNKENSIAYTQTPSASNQNKINNDGVNSPNDKKDLTLQSYNENLDYSELVNEFYAKDDIPNSLPQILSSQLIDYKNNRYYSLQVIRPEYLRTISDKDVLDIAYYYRGISYIETKGYNEAIDNFKWVIDSSSNALLQTKAKWYLGLTYLKINNVKVALPLLNDVSNNEIDQVYKQKAKQLLKKILK